MKTLEIIHQFLAKAIEVSLTAIAFAFIVFMVIFGICILMDSIKRCGGLKSYLFGESFEDEELDDEQAYN